MSARYLKSLATWGVMLIGLASCMGQVEKKSGSPSSTLQVDSNRSLDEILDELVNLTSDKTCYQDSDCKIAQFGLRMCGGSVNAFAYSTAVSDPNIVQELINEYNSVNWKINQFKTSTSEVCTVPELPSESECINSQCVEVN